MKNLTPPRINIIPGNDMMESLKVGHQAQQQMFKVSQSGLRQSKANLPFDGGSAVASTAFGQDQVVASAKVEPETPEKGFVPARVRFVLYGIDGEIVTPTDKLNSEKPLIYVVFNNPTSIKEPRTSDYVFPEAYDGAVAGKVVEAFDSETNEWIIDWSGYRYIVECPETMRARLYILRNLSNYRPHVVNLATSGPDQTEIFGNPGQYNVGEVQAIVPGMAIPYNDDGTEYDSDRCKQICGPDSSFYYHTYNLPAAYIQYGKDPFPISSVKQKQQLMQLTGSHEIEWCYDQSSSGDAMPDEIYNVEKTLSKIYVYFQRCNKGYTSYWPTWYIPWVFIPAGGWLKRTWSASYTESFSYTHGNGSNQQPFSRPCSLFRWKKGSAEYGDYCNHYGTFSGTFMCGEEAVESINFPLPGSKVATVSSNFGLSHSEIFREKSSELTENYTYENLSVDNPYVQFNAPAAWGEDEIQTLELGWGSNCAVRYIEYRMMGDLCVPYSMFHSGVEHCDPGDRPYENVDYEDYTDDMYGNRELPNNGLPFVEGAEEESGEEE